MTRKHFHALASTLKRNKPKNTGSALWNWDRIVSDVADVCRSCNSGFKREKFLEACGFNETVSAPIGNTELDTDCDGME